MKDRNNLWEAYNRAKQWGVRPSELYGIHEEYDAFCFDAAVSEFAEYVIGELSKIKARSDDQRKKMMEGKLRQILAAKDGKKKYADPAELLKG